MASQHSQRQAPSLLMATLALCAFSFAGCSDSGVTANVDPPTPSPTSTVTPSDTPDTATPEASPTQEATPTEGEPTPTPTATEIPTPTPTIGPGVTGDIAVPGDYATIQGAIDAAARGAIILVEAGTYNEDVDFKGKTLTLRSTAGPGATIIQGSGTGAVVRMSSGEGPGTLLKGFTIRGGIGALDQGGYRLGGGIYVANASPTIDGCILTGNFAEYGGGIAVERGEVQITGLRVHDNESSLFGGGVAALDARIEARGMIIWNNRADEGAGIYLNDVTGVVSNSYLNANEATDAGGGAGIRYCDGELELVNNIFAENSAPDGASVFFLASESRFTSNIVIYSEDGEAIATDSENYTPVLSYNNFWNNPDGAVGGGLSGLTGTGNLNNSDPRFESYSRNKDPLDDLLTLGDGSPCIDAGPPLSDDGIYTDADGTRNDIGLYGGPFSDDRAYGDEDGDGIPDLWEEINGLNPYADDAGEDPDDDGLTNLEEYEANTQASIPDTDADGVLDGEEVEAGQDPLDPSDNRPVADAGATFYIEPGELATLDGSNSSDPNDDPLTYQWTLVLTPEGSAVTQGDIDGADEAIATFTPDEEGAYAFELVVNDGRGSSFPDRVDVITSGTLFVSPDGPISTIQRAINQSRTGQRILVAPGTYNESIVFSQKRVRVESIAGPQSTIISSPALKPVATFERNLQGREDGFRAELIGFTLTNGFGSSIGFPEPYGGGLFITGAAPRIQDCIITRNAAANGGGVSVIGGGLEMVNSTIDTNGVEGVGGGIFMEDPALGVYIRRTVISNNIAGGAGGIYLRMNEADNLPVEITNSTFFRNTANSGAGGAIRVRSSGDLLKILNNVMVDNSATSGAGLSLEGDGDDSVIQGNIIAFNEGSGVALAATSEFNPTFSYNDVYENGLTNYEGAKAQLFANRDGNISVDPLFARLDLTDDDGQPIFVLRPGSLAIDAGPPASDFNDKDGSRNDMGIYGGPDADLTELSDEDEDGLPDYWEEDNDLDPEVPDADGDPDMDGADNLSEYQAGTDPGNPDTDGDGISDGAEIDEGQDPIDPSDNLPVAIVAEEIVRVEVARGAELDGSPSSDPQDDPLTYAWALDSAPEESVLTSADISGADQAIALFAPDVKGTFVFSLVVSDGRGQSAPARLSVVASENIIVGEEGTYDTIQAAIEAAGNTDTVLVREGTYIEDIDFLGKSVTVESVAGPELTIIQGTSLSSVVSFIRGERPEATLKGFTIRGGFGRILTEEVEVEEGTPATIEFVAGGGIVIDDGASPTLEDIVVRGNDADIGGGIYIRGGEATLRDVTIEANDSAENGGGLAMVQADVRVIRGLIVGNESNGVGGVYIEGGAPSLTNTIIMGNEGSGSGGMGGIFISGCGDAMRIQNVTVVGNAGRSGSSLVSDGCTGDIDSSIFAFGSAGPGITLLNEALPTFLYNDVYGHPGGLDYAEGGAAQLSDEANISADPLFINYTPGEFEAVNLGLTSASPCIDQGTPDVTYEDLDGTRNDIGATGGPQASAWGEEGGSQAPESKTRGPKVTLGTQGEMEDVR